MHKSERSVPCPVLSLFAACVPRWSAGPCHSGFNHIRIRGCAHPCRHEGRLEEIGQRDQCELVEIHGLEGLSSPAYQKRAFCQLLTYGAGVFIPTTRTGRSSDAGAGPEAAPAAGDQPGGGRGGQEGQEPPPRRWEEAEAGGGGVESPAEWDSSHLCLTETQAP